MILAIDPGSSKSVDKFAVCQLIHDGTGRVVDISVRRLKRHKAEMSIGERLLHYYNLLTTAQDVTLVVVEGPSYGNTAQYGVHDLAQIRGMVHFAAAFHWQCPCIQVPPKTLVKYATGNGNAKKDRVIVAAQQQGYTGKNDNEADAWMLACYAMFSPTMPDGTSPGPLHLEVPKILL